MTETLFANTALTVSATVGSSGFVLWLLKKLIEKLFGDLSEKVDATAADTKEQITRVHERIDRYEEAQRLCQLNLHQHFASKKDVERLDIKTDQNTERLVAVETTLKAK
ncbi:hypothetical protein SYK_02780 [Pseudodesulfovibrio nedwellii]|uniref:Uncharacterized protein n=1 Tax=Pseudodesulfovibrio nedwellii TaxID=2973072 RepID=A0ABM8AWV5_9BACT|nr:hypothetical protein [Pseudodesulfovibrio nedwellii]BDQ35918.1 hypothetical protein SYK_02780 [Pseudodesulfovibrio nedwellii]